MPYLFLALLAITTLLLLIELEPSKASFPHSDKIIHVLLFLSLSTTGYLSFPKHPIFIFVGLAFYGALTEVLQDLLTVTRHASFLDWIADIAGILLCLLVIHLFKHQAKAQHDF
ncbi:MAG: hypothetical protein ACKE5M_02000 [Methylophilaceae bacterium]